MLAVPNANEDQINAFRAYIERQVAANQAFVGKPVRAKDIQEAVQIQVEYFQSQMRAAVNDAMQVTDKIATSSKPSAGQRASALWRLMHSAHSFAQKTENPPGTTRRVQL